MHIHAVLIEYLAIIPVPPLRSKTYPQIAKVVGAARQIHCLVHFHPSYIGNQSGPIFQVSFSPIVQLYADMVGKTVVKYYG